MPKIRSNSTRMIYSSSLAINNHHHHPPDLLLPFLHSCYENLKVEIWSFTIFGYYSKHATTARTDLVTIPIIFKVFNIQIPHEVVAMKNFSPLFDLYAWKDRKIKLTRRILWWEKYFDDWKWTLQYENQYLKNC